MILAEAEIKVSGVVESTHSREGFESLWKSGLVVGVDFNLDGIDGSGAYATFYALDQRTGERFAQEHLMANIDQVITDPNNLAYFRMAADGDDPNIAQEHLASMVIEQIGYKNLPVLITKNGETIATKNDIFPKWKSLNFDRVNDKYKKMFRQAANEVDRLATIQVMPFGLDSDKPMVELRYLSNDEWRSMEVPAAAFKALLGVKSLPTNENQLAEYFIRQGFEVTNANGNCKRMINFNLAKFDEGLGEIVLVNPYLNLDPQGEIEEAWAESELNPLYRWSIANAFEVDSKDRFRYALACQEYAKRQDIEDDLTAAHLEGDNIIEAEEYRSVEEMRMEVELMEITELMKGRDPFDIQYMEPEELDRLSELLKNLETNPVLKELISELKNPSDKVLEFYKRHTEYSGDQEQIYHMMWGWLEGGSFDVLSESLRKQMLEAIGKWVELDVLVRYQQLSNLSTKELIAIVNDGIKSGESNSDLSLISTNWDLACEVLDQKGIAFGRESLPKYELEAVKRIERAERNRQIETKTKMTDIKTGLPKDFKLVMDWLASPEIRQKPQLSIEEIEAFKTSQKFLSLGEFTLLDEIARNAKVAMGSIEPIEVKEIIGQWKKDHETSLSKGQVREIVEGYFKKLDHEEFRVVKARINKLFLTPEYEFINQQMLAELNQDSISRQIVKLCFKELVKGTSQSHILKQLGKMRKNHWHGKITSKTMNSIEKLKALEIDRDLVGRLKAVFAKKANGLNSVKSVNLGVIWKLINSHRDEHWRDSSLNTDELLRKRGIVETLDHSHGWYDLRRQVINSPKNSKSRFGREDRRIDAKKSPDNQLKSRTQRVAEPRARKAKEEKDKQLMEAQNLLAMTVVNNPNLVEPKQVDNSWALSLSQVELDELRRIDMPKYLRAKSIILTNNSKLGISVVSDGKRAKIHQPKFNTHTDHMLSAGHKGNGPRRF